jgi:hypothetical protein
MNNKFKKIWAVVAGFLVVVILSVVTDIILEKAGILSVVNMSTGMLVLAFVYRSIYTVAGGYVTAMLAPAESRMKLVKILGIVGTIAGVLGVIVGWDLSDHWYPIALAVTAFPLVYWGGKLKK